MTNQRKEHNVENYTFSGLHMSMSSFM